MTTNTAAWLQILRNDKNKILRHGNKYCGIVTDTAAWEQILQNAKNTAGIAQMMGCVMAHKRAHVVGRPDTSPRGEVISTRVSFMEPVR